MRPFIRRTPCLSTTEPPSARLLSVLTLSGCLACLGCANGVTVSDSEFEEIQAEVAAGLVAPLGGGSSVNTGGTSITSSNAQTTASDVTVAGDGIDGISNGSQVIPSPPLTGGNCNGAAAPIAVGGCASGGALSLTYTDRTSSANNNQLSMTFGVQNSGSDFNLSDLVIRYWFTADGNSGFTAEVDYASVNGVCVDFGDAQGSGYADVGFSSGDIVNGDGIDQVQIRVHTDSYDNLDQSNDFSFMGGADGALNQNVTAYLRGERVAGCEPE